MNHIIYRFHQTVKLQAVVSEKVCEKEQNKRAVTRVAKWGRL